MHATPSANRRLASQLRWLARTTGEIMVVLWSGYFVAELFSPDNAVWPPPLLVHGAILAVILRDTPLVGGGQL